MADYCGAEGAAVKMRCLLRRCATTGPLRQIAGRVFVRGFLGCCRCF